MYEIEFVRAAEKQFLKLPVQIQLRIKAVLQRARIRPQAHFNQLVGVNAYKLRVGDYRIIADIEHGKLIILVLEIGHRRNVYK